MDAVLRARGYLSIILVWLAVFLEVAFVSALAVSMFWFIRSVR